jgi:transcriptional regulator with XRE-family HTH domain
VPPDEFETVRRERSALRQAQRATELLAVYQQRSIELARLRREAIDRLRTDEGMSFTAIAAKLGISKGRITQIRQTAPPVERAFFGVGPITVAVPLRKMPGRPLPVISSEDTLSAERLTALLSELLFAVNQYRIPVDGRWTPTGDVVAICGPKSSPVTGQAIEADPVLSFAPDDSGRWGIADRSTGEEYASPIDTGESPSSDLAYVGRLRYDDSSLLVIAGIHALGSIGAVDYISRHLADLYAAVGSKRFSMVVRSDHDGETVTDSDLICPPRLHE